MRRSRGAAPVGASDRKVSLPIGRCDGGARGTRGRASYVRFLHPQPFVLFAIPPLARSLAASSSHRVWSRLARAAAAAPGRLSLAPAARLGRSLSPRRSPSLRRGTATPATPLAPLQTHGISALDRLTASLLLPLERTVAAPRRASQLRRARHGV